MRVPTSDGTTYVDEVRVVELGQARKLPLDLGICKRVNVTQSLKIQRSIQYRRNFERASPMQNDHQYAA